MAACGQGTVYFNNFVSGLLSAPVYGPEPSSPTESRTGNTSSGIPAGTQTYNGPLIAGSGYTAQLWAAPGADQSEGSLQAVLASTTTFRTGSASGFVLPPAGSTAIPNAPAGTIATLQLRAWDNQGGTVTSWDQAGTVGATRGSSLVFNSQPLGSSTATKLVGLQSFSLAVAPEPSTFALGTLGTALIWGFRRKQRS